MYYTPCHFERRADTSIYSVISSEAQRVEKSWVLKKWQIRAFLANEVSLTNKDIKDDKQTMIINKAILHILDFNSGMCIISQKELNFADITINEYIEKHLEHIKSDLNQKSGVFSSGSTFFVQLDKYLAQQASFIEISALIGNTLYEQIAQSENPVPTDLLVVDFSDNGVRYLALLLLTSKMAYTHQVSTSDGSIHNEIIKHHAILPNTTQKVDSYALIACDNFAIGFVDKKRIINGQETYLLPEILLQCTSTISGKEAIKTVSQIAAEVAEKHGANSAVILSKAKNYLLENAETSASFSPTELGQEVFAGSQLMQQEFESQIIETQLPRNVKVEKTLAMKTAKNHKIKTDTGIEITFPAEYFENHDFIEFINNPDGTISIEVKNIGRILNK